MARVRVVPLMLVAAAAATLQCANAQGAVGLSYTSYTGGNSCPTADPCWSAGYTYVYDLTGNAVFEPKSSNTNCDAFIGFAGAGSTTASGTLTLYPTGDINTAVTATYTLTQMVVTITSGCTLTFARGSAGSSSSAGAVDFASYTGGSACAPDACLQAGFNYLVDDSANVAFLSRNGNENLACNGYAGSATQVSADGNSGTISFEYVLDGSSVQQMPTAVTATFAGNTLTTTVGICTYTYREPASSAAAPTKVAAVLAAVVEAATVAAFV
jgi:hypothetical protein